MPQLDFTAFAPQLVWLAITFVVLYLLMAKGALPRIAEVLEERQDRIADDLEQAQKLRGEADQAIEAYEEALADARERAHALGVQARDAAQAAADKRNAEHEEKGRRTMAEAEARIAAARAEAMGNVREVAGEAARAATAKLIGIDIDGPAALEAVDGAMGEGE
jgi:F-type H+-transporting ATPase subunit b